MATVAYLTPPLLGLALFGILPFKLLFNARQQINASVSVGCSRLGPPRDGP